ncbi:MAG: DUF4386 domain-containing protein [Deinococcota bacterium]|jgi:hypothetical protein|nr:DUF4386 domain-containing protein [Deinococcota bacterium]
MGNLQKMGGVAALIMAATFVVGFVLLLTLLMPAGYFAADVDPIQNAAFLADNQAVLYVWYLTIYVVFGVFLVVSALALYERLKAGSPAIAQIATAFGIIWAGLVIASGMVANVGLGAVVDLYGSDPTQAASLWLAVNTVVIGLGGGNEIVGGLWVLLISWAALQAGGLPKLLNYFGVGVSVAGILTAVPALAALEVLGAVFGFGLIVWFVWVGIVMLRSSPSAAAYNREERQLKERQLL